MFVVDTACLYYDYNMNVNRIVTTILMYNFAVCHTLRPCHILPSPPLPSPPRMWCFTGCQTTAVSTQSCST